MFALEPNEMMAEVEVEIDVPDENTEELAYHKETVTVYKPIINPNYEQEQAEKERQRIQSLTCTKRVFALMLQQLGITYSRLKELIATNEQAQLEWDLCVELQRSNPLLDIMGAYLQITPEQIDILFRVANGELPLEDLQATVQQPEVNEEVEE